MAIKNLMEDIVSALVDEVLSKTAKNNPEIQSDVYKEDIISYVLNRVQPKYYTSERGILHGKLECQFVFQHKTDILLFTHEAISTIKSRRTTEISASAKENNKELFLPHILGEILEDSSFLIIPGVQVTLLYKGKPAQMIDDSWKNPYITNKATEGFFHFWPKLPDGEKKKGKNTKVSFAALFNHPKLTEKKIEFELEVVNDQNAYRSFIMPMVLLQKLDGVDLAEIAV
jgi:competence protein ComFB